MGEGRWQGSGTGTVGAKDREAGTGDMKYRGARGIGRVGKWQGEHVAMDGAPGRVRTFKKTLQ